MKGKNERRQMLSADNNDSPMNRKNMSKPNSRIDALSVRPKICNPFECLDNLNIRNTRTKRITRNIAKDIA